MESSKGTEKNKVETTAEPMEGAKGLYDRPLVLEGKRKRKSTELFSFNEKEKTRKATEYTGGEGVKLGDIPYIQHCIGKTKAENLRVLFKLCYDRVGARIELKRSLREFTGFSDAGMAEKKKAALDKLTVAGLKPICEMLGLETNGNKGDIVSRIIKFLEKPYDHGKEVKIRRRSSTGSAPRKKSKLSESDDELDEDAIDKEEEGDDSVMETSQADQDNEETSTEKENKVNDESLNKSDNTTEDQKQTEQAEPTTDKPQVESDSKEGEKKEPEKEA